MATERKTRQASAVRDGRKERLKAALKANIARRKTQARARKAATDKDGQD